MDDKIAHDPEVAAVRERIETSRDELSETVEALSYKTDVHARTKEAVDESLATMKSAVSSGLETVRDVATGVAEVAADQASALAEHAKGAAASTVAIVREKLDAAGDRKRPAPNLSRAGFPNRSGPGD